MTNADEERTMSWQELDRQYCWHPFTQAQTAAPPLVAVRAEGAYVYDEHGKRYFDAVSSWWVNLHGHAHPAIAAAIAEQARTMPHVMFAGITHPVAIELAQALVKHLPKPLQYVFYTDNGSTAVEVALKMACQYWANLNEGSGERQGKRRRFLAFEGAYHGDTFGAMSAGKSSGFYGPFADWLFEVDFLPYPATWEGYDPATLAAIESAALTALDSHLAQHGDELVAFILEPLVQGASGMRMVRPAFLRTVLDRVRAKSVPIIFDEVMTGFGRTGTFLAAAQLDEFAPDILCLSKGLTGGFLPMGATIAQPHIYNAFLSDDVGRALLHGHSYTANPLGCAAALASLKLLSQRDTIDRIVAIRKTHRRLLPQLAQHPLVEKPRQCGTIAAFGIKPNALQENDQAGYGAPAGQWLRERMIEKGVLLRPLGNTVYLIPPYCTTVEELESVYGLLSVTLDEWSGMTGDVTLGGVSTDLF